MWQCYISSPKYYFYNTGLWVENLSADIKSAEAPLLWSSYCIMTTQLLAHPIFPVFRKENYLI